MPFELGYSDFSQLKYYMDLFFMIFFPFLTTSHYLLIRGDGDSTLSLFVFLSLFSLFV